MDLSPQQGQAVDAVLDWYDNSDNQVFRLFGYAGTGKTTIARYIADILKERNLQVRFAAFTGKAAHVLRTKGTNASTIHSLIYKLVGEKSGRPEFILDEEDSPMVYTDFLGLDEVSMVNQEMGEDLLSFGKKVLVLGDPGQLPPISGTGFFTDTKPDFMLTEIHRQAADSPIIQLATMIRQGKMPGVGEYGTSCIQRGMSRELVMGADQLIVGKNATRKESNFRARALKGYKADLPQVGDKLVCLRNNRRDGFMNGTIWYVKAIDTEFSGLENQFFPPSYVCDLQSEDGEQEIRKGVQMHREHFTGGEIPPSVLRRSNEFDFGYALTCHKSQGSQWQHVVVCDESRVFRENRWRWLYTAVTRAADKVTICET